MYTHTHTHTCTEQVYSFALRQLLTSESDKMRATLKDLTYDPVTARPDPARLRALVTDAAVLTGVRKRRVVLDVMATKGGRAFARRVLRDSLRSSGVERG